MGKLENPGLPVLFRVDAQKLDLDTALQTYAQLARHIDFLVDGTLANNVALEKYARAVETCTQLELECKQLETCAQPRSHEQEEMNELLGFEAACEQLEQNKLPGPVCEQPVQNKPLEPVCEQPGRNKLLEPQCEQVGFEQAQPNIFPQVELVANLLLNELELER